ncbi:MAG: alpha/beta hydrolase [Mesorhizobium amorphae]|nr:MAG: alpha/beta hydrolase [Mesorhizobium amorphae]
MTQVFTSEGLDLAFSDPFPEAGREPVLLVHGFASSAQVNWLAPGWVETLGRAGYRPIAFDHRGHGQSAKPRVAEAYAPERMAADTVALLDHLGLPRAHFFGYSMGARVSVFAALLYPARVFSLILGGLGIGLVEGVGDWDPIADALLAPDASALPPGRPKMFRTFADQTRSDREALALCIATSRTLVSEADAAGIAQPTLIGVGTRDDIAGSAQALAALMPNAQAFSIEGRDHMLAVGDRTFKARALEFLAQHPLSARNARFPET